VGQDAAFENTSKSSSNLDNLAPISASTWAKKVSRGIDMSGWRPLIKGYFAAMRLIVGAVMSSACLMRVMTPVGPDVVR
jgi:hypothetical protein